jgi:nucleoside-diphosphate-sugar epimerase
VIVHDSGPRGEGDRSILCFDGGMKLLVTGGSSFVGAHFCLRAREFHDVIAVHHKTRMDLNGVTPFKADLRTARDRLRLAEVGADAVVHLATKVKGAAAGETNRRLMDAVLSLGIPVVYASSTVVHWTRSTPYGDSRREDEQRLLESGLPWAVVRPSAPYGRMLSHHQPGHSESFHTLVGLVRCSPWVPVIGDGQYRRQPVHVDDFSDAILRLLAQPLPGKAFDAGGEQALSFDQIIDTIAAALHRPGRKLHLPKALFVQLARLHGNFDADLIGAVDEDEVADSSDLSELTGVRFRPFSEGVRCLI